MRAEDLYRLRSTGSVAVHPTTDEVVFTIGWPDEESDSNRAELHVHTGAGHRKLTDGPTDVKPVFSPSGTRLAFLRRLPKQPSELRVMAWGPGESSVVGTFPDGVVDARWLDDDRIAVLAAERPEDQVDVERDELGRRAKVITTDAYRFNGRGYMHDRPQRLFVVDVDTGDQVALTPAGVECRTFAVERGGQHVAALLATNADSGLTGAVHAWVVPTDGAERVRLTPEPGDWSSLAWAGDTVVVIGSPTVEVGFPAPYACRPGDDGTWSEPERLSDVDVNADSFAGIAPVGQVDSVITVGAVAGGLGLQRFGTDGSHAHLYQERSVLAAFDARHDGSRIVASITTSTRPAELWDISGEPVRLVALNDDVLAELDLVEPEPVKVPSTHGAVVEAWVVRPPASAPSLGSPGPGLVYVHGGPMAQYGYNFFDEFQLAAAEGFTVIGGNPRGADGYGNEWATAIVGAMGERDWDDVQAITDHLASLPEVDPERIGIGGGSYGGFMTAWATSHSNRYKAALVERAVTNWETFASTSDIGPYFVRMYTGATVESDIGAVRRQSPTTYVADVTTPTMVIHSEEDWRCPIEQGEQWFAGLRRNGVEAVLVRFPAENHELTRGGSPKHRVERFALVHRWFLDHL